MERFFADSLRVSVSPRPTYVTRLDMRIVVAMSGGVDSSVAAALLAEQGHHVIGVSMQLYDQTSSSGDKAAPRSFGTCCTIDDLYDARRVAAAIGIPHYILNFESQFDEHVVSNFVREYVGGRTPIPCAHCNSDLKFSSLLDRARAFDAALLATGHYARVDEAPDGSFRLCRGSDASKDQSYFLFSLTQEQLAQAVFPVGHLDKEQVRSHARRLRLKVADKPDSQEICFVPDGDYAAFVERHAPDARREGTLISQEGSVLGRHDGVHRFTIGQRKGLGLSSSTPLYVLEIRPDKGEVVVGSREALHQHRLTASGVNWISGRPEVSWRRVSAQIRHRHVPASGQVRAIGDDQADLEFDSPQTAITPGQAVVFYDGDVVVGGGWID
jgi:tRNA-specific 2-thiouridylase